MNKQLGLLDILNIQDVRKERVEVPEWGGFIMIQSMTGEGRDAYEMSLFKTAADGESDYERDLSNARAKLIAACAIGPDGKRMFKTDEQVALLGTKSAAALDRVFSACQRLNAVSNADIEEIVGKSETDQP